MALLPKVVVFQELKTFLISLECARTQFQICFSRTVEFFKIPLCLLCILGVFIIHTLHTYVIHILEL